MDVMFHAAVCLLCLLSNSDDTDDVHGLFRRTGSNKVTAAGIGSIIAQQERSYNRLWKNTSASNLNVVGRAMQHAVICDQLQTMITFPRDGQGAAANDRHERLM